MSSEPTDDSDLRIVVESARPPGRAGPPPALLEAMASPRVGMVQALDHRPSAIPGGGVHTWYAVLSGLRVHADVAPEEDEGWRHTSSAKWSRDESIVAALAEGLERYAGFDDASVLPTIRPSAEDLQLWAVPVDGMPRVGSSENVPTSGPSSTATSGHDRWCWGHSLATGQPCLAPEVMAVPFASRPTPPELSLYRSTTGMAAASDPIGAQLAGLFELVERDAYAITHLNKLPLPEVDVSSVQDVRLRELLRRFHGSDGWTLRAWDMTLDIAVPTALAAVIVEVDAIPAVLLAAATRATAEAAVVKAASEAMQAAVRRLPQQVREARADPNPVDPSRLSTYLDHAALGMRADYVDDLAWLLQPRSALKGVSEMQGLKADGEPDGLLDAAVAQVVDLDLEPFAFCLTPPEAQEIGGLEVWRVLVPGAQPLGLGPLAYLDSERVRWAPVRAGYRPDPLTEGELNRQPHCFP